MPVSRLTYWTWLTSRVENVSLAWTLDHLKCSPITCPILSITRQVCLRAPSYLAPWALESLILIKLSARRRPTTHSRARQPRSNIDPRSRETLRAQTLMGNHLRYSNRDLWAATSSRSNLSQMRRHVAADSSPWATTCNILARRCLKLHSSQRCPSPPTLPSMTNYHTASAPMSASSILVETRVAITRSTTFLTATISTNVKMKPTWTSTWPYS